MLKYLLLCLALAAPVFAVQPSEQLADPALEARAREISKGLRCPVCQGENIDDSNAEVARDLRVLVRERLLAGDADMAVIDYITARYGEYVLFEPEAKGANLILYWLGPLAFAAALGGAFVFVRSRKPSAPEALSPEDEARLAEILRE